MKITDLTPDNDIDEAILKLKELEEHPVTPQHAKACRLGIEALEREWVRRRGIANIKEGLLPSETER